MRDLSETDRARLRGGEFNDRDSMPVPTPVVNTAEVATATVAEARMLPTTFARSLPLVGLVEVTCRSWCWRTIPKPRAMFAID